MVLVTIVMTMTLIRTLSLASRGSVNPEEVLMVMGYAVLGYLPTILTLSLFIAIVGTLTRMYRDSEMVIWFSAGRGLSNFAGPLFRFSWPVLLVIALLALVIWPWANQQTQQLKERYGKRGDLERVAPGQFQESASGRRVFFLDKDTPDNKSGRNIFISTLEKDRETVTSARSGRIETLGGDQYLVLTNGQRLENSLKGEGLRISEFELHGTRVKENNLIVGDESPAKARSTLALVRNPTPANQGELAWRFGLLFAAANLLLLGIGLAATNPRRASNWNLLFALLAFVVYFNLINLSQAWIAGGRMGFGPMMLLLHGGGLALALGLIWWRDHGASLLASQRRAAA